jgi:hypothetical protein
MYTARGFGEAASIAAAPLGMAIADGPLKPSYDRFKDHIARSYIEPDLEKWDARLAKAKSLDPPHERKERHALPRDEQARKITDLLVDQFIVKFGSSLLAQFATQDYFINKFNAGVPRKYNVMSIAIDRGVQIGSVIMANTLASDQAIAAQNGLIKIFKNAGMDEEKAEEWANYGVNFAAPNIIAALASAEFLTLMAKRG